METRCVSCGRTGAGLDVQLGPASWCSAAPRGRLLHCCPLLPSLPSPMREFWGLQITQVLEEGPRTMSLMRPLSTDASSWCPETLRTQSTERWRDPWQLAWGRAAMPGGATWPPAGAGDSLRARGQPLGEAVAIGVPGAPTPPAAVCHRLLQVSPGPRSQLRSRCSSGILGVHRGSLLGPEAR